MVNFILKRLLYGLLVLFGVVTIIFLLFNVLPGDPARMMLGATSRYGFGASHQSRPRQG